MQQRRVWLTGHTGFMGSWLAAWLLRRGARVWGYSLAPPTSPSAYEATRLGPRLAADVRGDVRDADAVAAALDEADPDVILHLAAQPLVRRSYREPVGTFSANVMGTAQVLDAVRRRGRPCAVVVATTDKCYEPHPDGAPHVETDRLGGHDPYAASKAAAELVVDAWRRSYFPPEELARHGVSLASVRAGNAIGGGDWAEDRILPDAVRAALADRPLELRMPGAVRPWQHVLEPLSGYLALARRMLAAPSAEWCAGWNFAPDDATSASVGELVDRFAAGWPRVRPVVVGAAGQPHETRFLRLDAQAARRRLGWRPAWTWGEAADRAAAWYRAFHEGADAAVLVERDLQDHEEATR